MGSQLGHSEHILVSVIIPLFNSERYIGETIQSVLDQTYENLEVIIVNDGSTDKSEDIVQAYLSDSRVKYIKQENKGAAAARNIAFSNSNGELIQYLDADDILDKEKISRQVMLYRRYGDRYLYSSTYGVIQNENKQLVLYSAAYNNFSVEDYFRVIYGTFGVNIFVHQWLVPRILIRQTVGWDEQLTVSDDGDFFNRVVSLSSGVLYERNSIVYHRVDTPNSLGKKCDRQSFMSILKTVDNLSDIIKDKRLDTGLLHRAYSRLYCLSFSTHPDIAMIAKERLFQLGFNKIHPHGGKIFRTCSQLFGINVTIRVYKLLGRI